MSAEPTTLDRFNLLLNPQSLEVIKDVSPDDGMYGYAPEVYAEAGQKALRCIGLAMLAAEREEPESILDFACGAGRVLRYLKAAFPEARLTGCDVLASQVEFCERVFGITGVVGKTAPEEIELPGPFDLIWSGSLLTHIDGDRWLRFLKMFESHLAPGGIAVFTAYGRAVVDEVRSGNPLGMTDEQVIEILRDFEEQGFGFQVTPPFPPQGDALASRAWVCGLLDEVPSLDLLLYIEHAWLGQDVIACVKNAGD